MSMQYNDYFFKDGKNQRFRDDHDLLPEEIVLENGLGFEIIGKTVTTPKFREEQECSNTTQR